MLSLLSLGFMPIASAKSNIVNFLGITLEMEQKILGKTYRCFKPKLQSPNAWRSAGDDCPLRKLLFSLMLLWEEVFVVLGTYELENSGNC